MKIALIELDYHAECLNSFCKAFKGSGDQVSIYTNEDIYQDLSKEDYVDKFQWIVKNVKTSTGKFLKNELAAINRHDIVFLSTVESSYRALANIDFKPVTILRIHAVNGAFHRMKNIHIEFKPAYIYRAAVYLVKELLLGFDWYYLKKFLSKVDYLTFTSEFIRHNFCKADKYDYDTLPMIPLAVFTPPKPSPADELFYITITGEVNQKKRDYKVVYDAFKTLIPKLSKKVVLTFAGNAKGYSAGKCIDKFLKLSGDYFQITSYNTAISQAEFNSIMFKTDMLLCPLVKNTWFKIYNEKVGETQISGSISDIIRYGKPTVIPGFYPVENALEPIIDKYYNAKDLSEILLRYINGNLLKERNRKVADTLEEYEPQNIYRKIIDIFTSAT